MANLSDLIHGTKPQVAGFIPTDPIEMLNQLLHGEIKSWPQIEQLGNLYQQYMLQSYDQAIPGFSDMLKEGAASAKEMVEGKIPQDVQGVVNRTAAERGLASGFGTIDPRDLMGQTSMDVMKEGQNAAQRWMSMAQGTIMPPSSQLYTPQWYTQFMAEQNQARQATQQFKYNVAAMPDPAWADRGKLLAAYGGMALGGAMGGGGGGGAASAIGNSAVPVNMGPAQSQQFGQAFGPQMEAAFPESTFAPGGGTYGGGGGGAGYAPLSAYPQSGYVNSLISGGTPAGYNFSAVPPGSYPPGTYGSYGNYSPTFSGFNASPAVPTNFYAGV